LVLYSLTKTVRPGRLLPSDRRGRTRERERERERAEIGGGGDSPEEGRAVDGDDAELAEEGLLLHLQQAARRGRPWFAGASMWPGRSSVARASPASWVKEARENKMLSGRLQRLPSVAWSSQ
jgi:hypothetical protein